MGKEEAIELVKSYAGLIRKHLKVDKIYLYGSYAKDKGREDSDIDVAIIVDNNDEDFFTINPLLWKLRRQIDDRIEPILIEREYDFADFIGVE